MPALDTTALAAVLKTQYTQKKVNLMVYPKNPFYAMVRKDTNFLGDFKVVALRQGAPQGRAAQFAVAQTNITPSSYKRFAVTRVRDYALAEITTEAAEASAKDAGALLRGLKSEIDGAMYTCMRSAAINMFRNGGGARGRISADSNPATPTITLANITDIVNFEVGMVLNTSTTDGTTGAKKTGTVTVAAVDRDAGTITATGNWTAGIATAATNDYIFQNGDFDATNSMIAGLAAWIPTSAPSATPFFGLDRSTDPVRLAGVRFTSMSGAPIESILINCAARVAVNGGQSDVAFLNPLDYVNLVNALGSKVIYDKVQASDQAEIGFDTVKIWGPMGPINVVADINCPQGLCYMLQLDTWAFETLNGAPRILDLDGNNLLRVSNSDSYQIRIGYYGNLTCEAPGFNAVAVL